MATSIDSDMSFATAAQESFSTLTSSLMAHVSDLKQLCALRGAIIAPSAKTPASANPAVQLSRTAAATEAAFLEVKTMVSEEEEGLAELKALVATMTALKESTTYMAEHLPPHLPGASASAAAAATGAAQVLKPSSMGNTGASAGVGSGSGAVAEKSKKTGATAAATAAASASSGPRKAGSKKQTRAHCPSVPYITQSELAATPKYIKGRLNLTQVNSVVDEVNRIASTKYALLAKPVTKLRGKSLAQFSAYCDQESKETEGRFFFADTDVRASDVITMDATGKAAMQSLQHLGRIKKVTGRGLTRYFLTV